MVFEGNNDNIVCHNSLAISLHDSSCKQNFVQEDKHLFINYENLRSIFKICSPLFVNDMNANYNKNN